MPQSSKIRAQVGPEDGPLITTGYRNSLFAKQGIMNTTDFAIEEKRDDTDQPTINSGTTQVFYLEKEGTEAGQLTLCVTVHALEPLVGGAKTYVRGSDFLGLAILHPTEAVTVSYAVNNLDRTFPDKIYKISENSMGKIVINSISEEYTNDGIIQIIPTIIKASNGHSYQWQFFFNEGGQDYEPIFKEILSSFQFSK